MGNLIQKALGPRFTFTLKNTTGAKVVVALLAANFDTLQLVEGAPNTHKLTSAAQIAAAGYDVDFVLDDGTIDNGLVASSANSKNSIREFREYVKNNLLKAVSMSVQANNVAAFNEVIEVVDRNPLKGTAIDYLPLTEFRSVDQYSTDKINVRNLNLDMHSNTLMLLPIENGHEVTISFSFEAAV